MRTSGATGAEQSRSIKQATGMGYGGRNNPFISTPFFYMPLIYVTTIEII